MVSNDFKKLFGLTKVKALLETFENESEMIAQLQNGIYSDIDKCSDLEINRKESIQSTITALSSKEKKEKFNKLIDESR